VPAINFAFINSSFSNIGRIIFGVIVIGCWRNRVSDWISSVILNICATFVKLFTTLNPFLDINNSLCCRRIVTVSYYTLLLCTFLNKHFYLPPQLRTFLKAFNKDSLPPFNYLPKNVVYLLTFRPQDIQQNRTAYCSLR
jgi:hypothetical protein